MHLKRDLIILVFMVINHILPVFALILLGMSLKHFKLAGPISNWHAFFGTANIHSHLCAFRPAKQ
jgi:hypothetical protein